MEQQTIDKATALLDKLLDAASTGIDKAPVAIADITKEFVTLYMIDLAPIIPLVLIIPLVITIKFLLVFYKNHKSEDSYQAREKKLFSVMCIVFCCIGIGGLAADALYNIKDMVKLHYAPKAFLIDKMTNKEGCRK